MTYVAVRYLETDTSYAPCRVHFCNTQNDWNYSTRLSYITDNLIPWASYQIRKIAGCACAGNTGIISPPPRVSDPDMHQGMCVTHVPWCMAGRYLAFSFGVGGRENVLGVPGICATHNFTYLARGPLSRRQWNASYVIKNGSVYKHISPNNWMTYIATKMPTCFSSIISMHKEAGIIIQALITWLEINTVALITWKR